MKSMGNLPEAGVGEVGQITILKVPEDLMILYSGSYLLESSISPLIPVMMTLNRS